MTYKLYTERFDNLAALTADYFDGFTIIEATGYWRGVAEQSTIIEIVTDNEHALRNLIRRILTVNKQEAVALACVETTTEFVTLASL